MPNPFDQFVNPAFPPKNEGPNPFARFVNPAPPPPASGVAPSDSPAEAASIPRPPTAPAAMSAPSAPLPAPPEAPSWLGQDPVFPGAYEMGQRAGRFTATGGGVFDPQTGRAKLGRDLPQLAGALPLDAEAARALSAIGSAVGSGAKYAARALGMGVTEASSAVRPVARAAVEHGFVLPPKQMFDEPPKGAALLEGMGGKIKLEQAASIKNQATVNNLSARTLGLSEGTPLTPEILREVRVAEGAKYQAVASAVPEVSADAEFLKGVEQLSGKKSEIYKHYGETSKHGEIEELVSNLKSNPVVSTQAAIDRVRQLRSQATANFKSFQAQGNPGAEALGSAQRRAADLIDDLIDRRVSDAPAYFSERVHAARKTIEDADKIIADAEKQVARASSFTEPVAQASAPAQVRSAQMAAEAAASRKASALADEQRWTQLLESAESRKDEFGSLVGQYRSARRQIAKTYDLEAAASPSGSIDAHVLARRAKRGRPLSGELKVIADTAREFPRSMQNPATFGGGEKHSILDFAHMGAVAASGHPILAAVPLARPAARKAVLSPAYQSRLVRPPPAPSTISPPDLNAEALARALGVSATEGSYRP